MNNSIKNIAEAIEILENLQTKENFRIIAKLADFFENLNIESKEKDEKDEKDEKSDIEIFTEE